MDRGAWQGVKPHGQRSLAGLTVHGVAKESDMTGGLNSNNSVCHGGPHDKFQESFVGLQAQHEVAVHVLDVLLSCINRSIQSKGGEGHHLCVAGPPKADQASGEEVTGSSSREGLMRGLDTLFMEVWMKE